MTDEDQVLFPNLKEVEFWRNLDDVGKFILENSQQLQKVQIGSGFKSGCLPTNLRLKELTFNVCMSDED